MHCGEDWGAMQHLGSFYTQMVRTELQNRGSEHAEAAWRKYYSFPEVQTATENLIGSVWNPNNRNCWGFKGIRFGREQQRSNFAQDVEFLSTLCSHPKFVLHTRRTPEKEFSSTVMGTSTTKKKSVLQHQCFDSYVGLPPNATDKEDGCKPRRKTNGSKQPQVFRHYLEDYLERNANFEQLWRYLGCESPLPNLNDSVVITTKNHSAL